MVAPDDLHRRGRPPLTPMDIERIRRGIVDATRQVFIVVGYQEISVERVLAVARVSRPTFYKYFSSLDEAVDQVLDDASQSLLGQLQAALLKQSEPMAGIVAAIDALRHWGEGLGELLPVLHAGLHDAASPVSRYRGRNIASLAEMIAQAMTRRGRPRPGTVHLTAFLNALEVLCFEYLMQTPGDDASWHRTRAAMVRLALGLLGDEDDWRHALQLALEFNVDLGSD